MFKRFLLQEGNEIFTLTGLKAKTTYRLRWQAPDKQYPDVVVETNGKTVFSVKFELRSSRDEA
jgi:hypothetical protein